MKNKVIFTLIVGGLVLSAGASQAALDGSKPMICAPRVVQECDEKGCTQVTPEEIDLAGFARVDLRQKHIRAVGKDRETPIEHQEHADGGWIIAGSDGIRGWSMTIEEETGYMTGAISGARYAFVIHGVCGQF